MSVAVGFGPRGAMPCFRIPSVSFESPASCGQTIVLPPNLEPSIPRAKAAMEFRTARQLELLIASAAGFDEKHVQVIPVGNAGDFRAEFVGSVAAVSSSRARSDVERACRSIKEKYLLRRF